MNDSKMDRRELIKKGVTLAGVVIGGGALLNPILALGEATPPPKKVFKLIDEQKNVTAKSLKFTHDGAKNPARKVDYANCGNCQMYRPKGEVDGVEVGSCNMLGGGYVKVTGWCTSWARDPKKLKKQ